MNNNQGLFILVLFLFLFIGGPLALIWALNSLFGFAIPYAFKTWLAMLVVTMAMGGTKIKFTKNERS